MTAEQFYKLSEDKQKLISCDEELQSQAEDHAKVGDIICYPQLDRWNIYNQVKYGVGDNSNDFWLGSSYRYNNKHLLCWTPHKDVALQIVEAFKMCGWKYRNTEVIELTDDFIRSKGYLVCTFAGFQPFHIMRDGNNITIVPPSPVVKEHLERIISG